MHVLRGCRSVLSLTAHNKATDRCCHNVLEAGSGRACLARLGTAPSALLLVGLGLIVAALCVVAAAAMMGDP